jgi:hypothetical protein
MKSVADGGLRTELESFKQVAPEKILAMYQEIASESGKELPPRPASFSHMIDVIVEHEHARLLEHPVSPSL